MALAPRLELKQSQTLVMTPQLQQAIKLLQYTNLELADFVAQEIERNPLLEHGDDGGPEDGPEKPEGAGLAATPASDAMLTDGAPMSGEALDTDLSNVYTDDPLTGESAGGLSLGMSGGASGSGGGQGDGDYDFTQNLSTEISLKDHLENQLGLSGFSPAEEMIAHFLIDSLDEAGYLREDLGVIADKLDCPADDVESVLASLQCFDPTGVFARSLQECLALQLKERDRLDPAMAAFLDNLELLAKHDIAGLKRACGVDGEDIADMVAELKTLNPKPGLAFSNDTVRVVVADVFVRRGPKGNWLVELNSEALPKVLISTRYHSEIAAQATAKSDKAFIAECFSTANWLVKALDQRARTILKVATEIVRQQEGFFIHGVKHLRPLNLRTVADAIGMHESTVSRVTTNKYLASERGLFEMKYFFTSSIPASGDGEAHSAEAVRERIKELIDAEAPGKVLSDDKIVEVLRQDNIDIARRTVAKYRESLRIPSSVQRRREKMANSEAGSLHVVGG